MISGLVYPLTLMIALQFQKRRIYVKSIDTQYRDAAFCIRRFYETMERMV
jgi:hypothetical protein